MNGNNLERKMIPVKIKSAIPKKRQELLKWNGWGYKDSRFCTSNNQIYFSGSRYPFTPNKPLVEAINYLKEKVNVKIEGIENITVPPMPTSFPDPQINHDFMNEIKRNKIDYSLDGEDRLFRCHGQTVLEIHQVRAGLFKRIPDIVLWPQSHDEVVEIVKLANENDVVVIPFGGGTSVSGAVTTPQDETERCIVVLDTSQMNRMLWLDKSNLVACFEAGIVGQDLERVLSSEGLTLGHEPDSYEFSTLGGWVATRASGMKKNVYGNIEDLVVRVKMVTAKGVLERNISSPRVSCGPDFNHIILGSEGSLGVVTEVLIKVRPLPPVQKYGSIVFPDFESGVKFMREIALRRCQPASVRLIDNEQFAFGSVLKVPSGFIANFTEQVKKFALTKIKGYDLKKLTVATFMSVGEKEEVETQMKLVFEIAGKHGGISGGEANGKKGYLLTYVVAYVRDFILDYDVIADSFETSMPWDKCEQLCYNVKAAVADECKKHGITHHLISCRVTQTYDAGACVYFYVGICHTSQNDPVHTFEAIENKARNVILASGGSISHHHGVGKIRAKWYKQSVSSIGVNLYKSTKIELDPKNIFATGNFLMPEDSIDFNKPSAKL